MHVAKIERRHGDRVYTSYLLRRTYREADKVRHETLGNISHLPASTIELIRRSLAGEALSSLEDLEIAASLSHGHVAAVYGQAQKLSLPALLGPPCAERDLALALVVARVCKPGSKLATSRWWRHTTLGADLGVAEASTDSVYAAMDWLYERQSRIEEELARRHLSAGGLVLYDVSSSYLEGRHCPLAALGHSRDKRKDKPQVTYGLTTDPEGRPISIEVFPGNTGDPTTLAPAVARLRERFGLAEVVMVGDRGMITKAQIGKLKTLGGISWITSLRAPAIKALVEAGALQLSIFDEINLAEITHPGYPGERLVACRNPALAAERARKRADLLGATEAELDKITRATCRARQPLRGKAKIGIRVGKVLGRYKVGKHFTIQITEDTFSFSRNADKIAAEAALDGIYVIRTSVGANELTPTQVVAAYKSLAQVEADFRSLKTVLLELRPIYHRLEERVRAHALICMLACYLAWHLRRTWAPLTFTDEQPRVREDPVAPARRSQKAYRKASRRHTEDGQPTQSFETLLEELATLTRNQVRVSAEAPTFEKLSTPTHLQRRAFELLEVSIPLRLA